VTLGLALPSFSSSLTLCAWLPMHEHQCVLMLIFHALMKLNTVCWKSMFYVEKWEPPIQGKKVWMLYGQYGGTTKFLTAYKEKLCIQECLSELYCIPHELIAL
jgi:hypothetical protein